MTLTDKLGFDEVQGKTDELAPNEVLEKFYSNWGIKEDDLEGKERTMRESVIIPNFPYNERNPALYELELQYLKDKGFNL